MLETSLLIFSISLLGMISPGPDFFLVIKNATLYQRSVAMMTALGIICALMVHMAYCVAGMAVIIANTPWLFNIMKYTGAAYLIYIGIQSFRSSNDCQSSIDMAKTISLSHKSAFVQGFLCNLLNPKATLFFLAIFTQVLNIHSSMGEKMWYAFIIWILAVIYWPLLIIFMQSEPVRKVIHRIQRKVNKVLGVALVAFGIKIALSSNP